MVRTYGRPYAYNLKTKRVAPLPIYKIFETVRAFSLVDGRV